MQTRRTARAAPLPSAAHTANTFHNGGQTRGAVEIDSTYMPPHLQSLVRHRMQHSDGQQQEQQQQQRSRPTSAVRSSHRVPSPTASTTPSRPVFTTSMRRYGADRSVTPPARRGHSLNGRPITNSTTGTPHRPPGSGGLGRRAVPNVYSSQSGAGLGGEDMHQYSHHTEREVGIGIGGKGSMHSYRPYPMMYPTQGGAGANTIETDEGWVATPRGFKGGNSSFSSIGMALAGKKSAALRPNSGSSSAGAARNVHYEFNDHHGRQYMYGHPADAYTTSAHHTASNPSASASANGESLISASLYNKQLTGRSGGAADGSKTNSGGPSSLALVAAPDVTTAAHEFETHVGEVINIRMQGMSDLRQRLDELASIQQREEEAFVGQMKLLLAESANVKAAHESAEGHFEKLLAKERAERLRAVQLMQRFKAEGSSVMAELKDALQSAQEKWKTEVERNARLSSQLRELQERQQRLESNRQPNNVNIRNAEERLHHHSENGNWLSSSAGIVQTTAIKQEEEEEELELKIATLTSLLEEEDAIIDELKNRNRVLEAKAAEATREKERLAAILAAMQQKSSDVDAEYDALLQQLRPDSPSATATSASAMSPTLDGTGSFSSLSMIVGPNTTLHQQQQQGHPSASSVAEANKKLALLNSFANSVIGKLKAEQKQRLFTEEQSAKVVEAQERIIRTLEGKVKELEAAATAAKNTMAAATANTVQQKHAAASVRATPTSPYRQLGNASSASPSHVTRHKSSSVTSAPVGVGVGDKKGLLGLGKSRAHSLSGTASSSPSLPKRAANVDSSSSLVSNARSERHEEDIARGGNHHTKENRTSAPPPPPETRHFILPSSALSPLPLPNAIIMNNNNNENSPSAMILSSKLEMFRNSPRGIAAARRYTYHHHDGQHDDPSTPPPPPLPPSADADRHDNGGHSQQEHSQTKEEGEEEGQKRRINKRKEQKRRVTQQKGYNSSNNSVVVQDGEHEEEVEVDDEVADATDERDGSLEVDLQRRLAAVTADFHQSMQAWSSALKIEGVAVSVGGVREEKTLRGEKPATVSSEARLAGEGLANTPSVHKANPSHHKSVMNYGVDSDEGSFLSEKDFGPRDSSASPPRRQHKGNTNVYDCGDDGVYNRKVSGYGHVGGGGGGDDYDDAQFAPQEESEGDRGGARPHQFDDDNEEEEEEDFNPRDASFSSSSSSSFVVARDGRSQRRKRRQSQAEREMEQDFCSSDDDDDDSETVG